MEGLDYSLDAGVMKRVNELLTLLSAQTLSKKEDFEQRYKYLITLYNELYPKIELNDRVLCEQVLCSIERELRLAKNGIKKTYFLSIANTFEREMREFIEKRINQKKEGFYHG